MFWIVDSVIMRKVSVKDTPSPSVSFKRSSRNTYVPLADAEDGQDDELVTDSDTIALVHKTK